MRRKANKIKTKNPVDNTSKYQAIRELMSKNFSSIWESPAKKTSEFKVVKSDHTKKLHVRLLFINNFLIY